MVRSRLFRQPPMKLPFLPVEFLSQRICLVTNRDQSDLQNRMDPNQLQLNSPFLMLVNIEVYTCALDHSWIQPIRWHRLVKRRKNIMHYPFLLWSRKIILNISDDKNYRNIDNTENKEQPTDGCTPCWKVISVETCSSSSWQRFGIYQIKNDNDLNNVDIFLSNGTFLFHLP